MQNEQIILQTCRAIDYKTRRAAGRDAFGLVVPKGRAGSKRRDRIRPAASAKAIRLRTAIACSVDGACTQLSSEKICEQLVELFRLLHHHKVAGAGNFDRGSIREDLLKVRGIVGAGVVRINSERRNQKLVVRPI